MGKSKEALLPVQKKHVLIRYQSERDKARARVLQRLGGSRAIRNEVATQDTLTFESCSSSMACEIEMSSESSRRM